MDVLRRFIELQHGAVAWPLRKVVPRSSSLASVSGVRKDVYPKEPSRVRVTDFFGSSRMIRHLTEEIVVDDEWLSVGA